MSIAFSLKATKRVVTTAPVVLDDKGNERRKHEIEEERVEFIKQIDENGLPALGPKKRELVIPLIETTQWRTEQARKFEELQGTGSTTTPSAPQPPEAENLSATSAASPPKSLEEQAIESLLKGESDKDSSKSNLVLPLLKQNQAPGMDRLADERDKFLLDVSMRPPEATLEDYENVPIEDFGAALLRGMGWSEGKPVGRAVYDEKNLLVNPIEYVPRHHRLGLGATPKPDFEEELGKKKQKRPSDYDNPPARSKDMVALPDSTGRSRHVIQVGEKLVDRKTAEKRALESSSSQEELSKKRKTDDRKSSPVLKTWLKPSIRVKIISKKYKDGRYYSMKAVVDEVHFDKHGAPYCTLRTDEGKALKDVVENMLETSIPAEGGAVLVLSGSHKGDIGKVLEKNRDKQLVVVKLSDNSVASFGMDDVCEYSPL